MSREQREAEKQRQFELKQQKRKEKHRPTVKLTAPGFSQLSCILSIVTL
ncbi:hypothetical protein [Bacteroides acidifaciens]